MSKRARNKEAGVALVEFALVLPLLLLITIVVVDLGHLMSHYIRLQGFCHAAVRYAQGVPSLETGGPFHSSIVDNDPICSLQMLENMTDSTIGQNNAHGKISKALCAAKQLDSFPLSGIHIYTWYDTSPGPYMDTVRVRIEARYHPLTPLLAQQDISVSVDASAPYLS